MNIENTQIDKSFWFQWLLATTAGVLAGGMLAIPIGFGTAEAVQDRLGETAAFVIAGILFGLLFGTGTGLAQWLVLRLRVPDVKSWIPASAIAAAAGLAFSFAIFTDWSESEAITAIIFVASLAVPISIGQWLVLRKQMATASWWLLVSVVGLGLGITVISFLGGEGREIVALTAGGLVTGVITGAGMVMILRQPASAF